ncbi:MAG: hypothetical protein NXI08_02645 [bacterium]|nr:hypothetical protein [bacterium]
MGGKKNRKELDRAFSKENAKKYTISYYGVWIGQFSMLLGVIAWFIERIYFFE